MLVRASSGSGGGGQTFAITNNKPDSRTIECGFAPKKVLVTCNYSGSTHWMVYWDAADAENVKSTYGNSTSTTLYSNSAIEIGLTSVTIKSSYWNDMNSTFSILICG